MKNNQDIEELKRKLTQATGRDDQNTKKIFEEELKKGRIEIVDDHPADYVIDNVRYKVVE